MDLGEGVEQQVLDQLVDDKLQELTMVEPTYGFTLVHDRVFITWFEHNPTGNADDYQFVAEPKAVELTAEEAEQFHDLLNHQNDQMQALLQGFVVNRQEQSDG